MTCPIQVYEEEDQAEWPEDGMMKKDEGLKGIQMMFGFIVDAQNAYIALSRETKVLRFWSGCHSGFKFCIADSVTALVGIIFRVIHCIAWSFTLQSRTELILWRISSIALVSAPAYLAIIAGLSLWARNSNSDFVTAIAIIIFCFLPPAVLMYIGAQIATVVLAFKALGFLKPAAYRTVEWTTFIPHI